MDIAKYIGLFLLKNEFCYLHGIGSLEVVKKNAVYNTETQEMDPPKYAVVYRETAGSIDDSFANFIANNERISIAHASNYLKDYCARATADLQAGREVPVPGIGKFYKSETGATQFSVDPSLQIQGRTIPFFKTSPIVERNREEALSKIIERTEFKEPKGDEDIEIMPPKVNWAKILVLSLLAVAIIGAGIYFLGNWGSSSDATETSVEAPLTESTEALSQEAATVADEPVAGPVDESVYVISINQYDNLERAQSRVRQLTGFGNTVSLWSRDSSTYSVVMRFPRTVDTSRVTDSLRTLFNPGGKVMVVQ